MRTLGLAALLILAGCRDESPPKPSAEQADQLNDADSMLDNLANEEGPENRSPGPSNTQ